MASGVGRAADVPRHRGGRHAATRRPPPPRRANRAPSPPMTRPLPRTAAPRYTELDQGDGHRRAHTPMGALGVTTIGALIPGVGFLAAGRRRLGGIVLAIALVLLGVILWIGLTQRRELYHIA